MCHPWPLISLCSCMFQRKQKQWERWPLRCCSHRHRRTYSTFYWKVSFIITYSLSSIGPVVTSLFNTLICAHLLHGVERLPMASSHLITDTNFKLWTSNLFLAVHWKYVRCVCLCVCVCVRLQYPMVGRHFIFDYKSIDEQSSSFIFIFFCHLLANCVYLSLHCSNQFSFSYYNWSILCK